MKKDSFAQLVVIADTSDHIFDEVVAVIEAFVF